MILIPRENAYIIGRNRDRTLYFKKSDENFVINFDKDILLKLNKISPEEFEEVKNVYFDPLSNYPRYKLTENTDKKRVIKVEKADLVVCPSEFKFKKLYLDYKLFLSNNGIYFMDFTSSESEMIQKYIKQEYMENIESIEIELTEIRKKFESTNIASQKTMSSLMNIDKGIYVQVIFDNDLDLLINKSLMDLTEEDYGRLEYMLNSTDETVVEMGLKMISTYNVVDNICRIGILLHETFHNIRYNKGFKATSFEQVISTLGIDYYKYSQSDTQKTYVAELVSKSTNENDKLFARNYLIDNMTNYIKETFDMLNQTHESLNIEMTLNIK